jgi:uncharacterized protein with GYD domain
MPRYLVEAKYTLEGIRGLRDKGGTARVAASKALIEEMGGTLESLYFCFGDTDAYLVCTMPDNVTAAAVSLIVGSAGGVATRTTVLLTPEEMDEAAQKQGSYRPPGS